MNDPEYGLLEKTGEVVSRMSSLGESLKTLASEIEARQAMEDRKNEPVDRMIRRGPIEIRKLDYQFSASWAPEARKISVNGEEKELVLASPHVSFGADPYDAAHTLIKALKERKAWG